MQSLKDYIIRAISLRDGIPIRVIEAVIDHEFRCAAEAFEKYESVEISNFGKFIFNRRKAIKKLEKISKKREILEKRLELGDSSCVKDLEILKRVINHIENKLYENKSDNRRLEEQDNTSKGT